MLHGTKSNLGTIGADNTSLFPGDPTTVGFIGEKNASDEDEESSDSIAKRWHMDFEDMEIRVDVLVITIRRGNGFLFF